MHVRFVHGTELHVVLACRGVEPLDVRLLDGKWFDVVEPRLIHTLRGVGFRFSAQGEIEP